MLKAGVKPVNELIVTLLKVGHIVRIKIRVLNEDVVMRLAKHYKLEVVKPVKEEKEKQAKRVI